MDRNTIIGFVLIGLLMMGMFYVNSKGSQALLVEQKRIEDSILRTRPKVNPALAAKDAAAAAAIKKMKAAGGMQLNINEAEQIVVAENEVMKITFTNKDYKFGYCRN